MMRQVQPNLYPSGFWPQVILGKIRRRSSHQRPAHIIELGTNKMVVVLSPFVLGYFPLTTVYGAIGKGRKVTNILELLQETTIQRGNEKMEF